MKFSRRNFLRAGAGAAVLAATPRWLAAAAPSRQSMVPANSDPDVRTLAFRAIEAARSAGAAYADVRLTHTYVRSIEPYNRRAEDSEEMSVGARALVDGYWGFASGSYWTPDEVVRLGREAVAQAKTNALGATRVVELARVPVVSDGHWETPVAIDPFEVPVDEVFDYLNAVGIYGRALRSGIGVTLGCMFYRQEKTFASTGGTFVTQVLRRTGGGLQLDYRGNTLRPDERYPTSIISPLLKLVGRGWESIREAPLREEIPALVARLEEEWRLPTRPVEVGRYDVVFDARSVGTILDATIGSATELDRAMGYEANAGGTSYLNDPLAMIGSEEMGSPLLTVVADRSTPGALATAKWDDEGVEPEPFTLVKDGVLTDFQTTRESAGWLEEYYARHGLPVRSHGCAAAPSALHSTMQHPPNMALAPGGRQIGLAELTADIEKGVLVTELDLDMDFQHSSGWSVGGNFYRIEKGKKVARLQGAGLLFRAPTLWKSLAALGGPRSLEWWPATARKGEPPRRWTYSVGAVPARFGNITIIDPTRRA
ncbi:MAG TPA: TldD/PmbA family protein [Gemmatimonadaceae bacterium]